MSLNNQGLDDLFTFPALVAGAMLCLGVSLGSCATLGVDESLVDAVFWPMVGAIGFFLAIFHHMLSKPTPSMYVFSATQNSSEQKE